MMFVIRWWKNISVAKKLYAVVGIMAFLIAAELFTLIFTMNILSAVRSFVGGEGLWSKAQKDAVFNLQLYSSTYEKRYFDEYTKHLQIPLGDRKARLELLKPNPNLNIIYEGFVQGEIHPKDIPALVRLIRNFYWVDHVKRALVIWNEADAMIDELMHAANELHLVVNGPVRGRNLKVSAINLKIEKLNERLTFLEKGFSSTLGEGSRWLESLLRWLLLFAVFTVEATGLCLTFLFTRNLSRSLKELSQTASEVGKANFSHEVPVRSNDELGQLAVTLNEMIHNLRKNIGERKRAESANKIKSLFLANMSHEIRTPLGVILGLTEILKDKDLTVNERMEYIHTIERTGNNLKRIINDILDISKVEAGHLEIEKVAFFLPDFIKELGATLAVAAEQRKNRLEFVYKDGYPSAIHTDRIRLRQILLNLIGNALKFTKNGAITVEYGTAANGEQLYFRITDTGIGISEEDIEILFQPFSQADNSSTRQYEGTGLGLILSKKLAHSLGGDVILEKSTKGKGSTFVLTIAIETPLKKESPTPALSTHGPSPEFLRGKRVLIVEDSLDNQLIIRVFLSKYQMSVDCANNGEEGVAKALAGNYDLVLMDVQMPLMDGHTATAELRKNGYLTPIVALTAHAMKEDRERCLRAGCNDYLTKPIELPLLFQTVYRQILRHTQKAIESKKAA